MEATPPRSLASSVTAGNITTALESFGTSSASATAHITASNDVAPSCLEVTGGVAPSDAPSPLTTALLLSGDSTPCVGSLTTKTAASMLNVASFDSSGTASASEVPSHHSEHAATTAPPPAARARGTGMPEMAANTTHPPALPHPRGPAPIHESRVEMQCADEASLPAEVQLTGSLSSLPRGGCFSASSSFHGSDRHSRTVRSGMSEPLQLAQTTRYLSPLDSAVRGGDQGGRGGGSAEGTPALASMVAAGSARPTLDDSGLPGQGRAARAASATQCPSTDWRPAACTASASSISSAVALGSTDAATPLSPELEVLATAPAHLVGRVPVRIHWCCATHWRAVRRTERGAQWAVDGAHADVYCVPAHLHAKRERRSLSASCVETRSEAERHGRAVSRTGENTRWLSEAAGEVNQQGSEVRTCSAPVAVPDAKSCAASDDAAGHEKDGCLQACSVSPPVDSRACAEMPTCEFCGREVEAYDCEESDEVMGASASTSEAGRVCGALPQWSHGRRGSATANATPRSSSQPVESRSNWASVSIPQTLSSSSESAATTANSEVVDVASPIDRVPWPNSAREEALMAAVALLQ
ncbi:hypothetical protein LSCM1_07856 [Leishmania martiniquensis]|uniref:Uncharacterized protein n=1 Tax=Leishmania martiniquensis TaxID=1580590 RepID=A0A836H054_9TRYP|nr:hypothetical protein LSCM1_07856 [Leishmania martiniquensis]